MEKVALKELFEKPISGEWGEDPEEVENGSVGVIRSTNFSKDIRFNQQSEVVQRVIDSKKVESKKLKLGDIVIEKSGGSPTQPVGRVLYYDLDDHETRLCNNFTSILRPKECNEPKYLAYLMQNLYKRGQVLKYQNKTTGIINLKLDNYLKDTEVEVPPIQTQQKIVQVLDKAQSLIDKRKEQIELMDELIQSTFYEMFGDPVVNEKGWESKDFEKGLVEIKYGTSTPPEFTSEGIPFIRATNIKNGRILKSNMKYITCNEAEKISKCKLAEGDILIVRSGVNTGDTTCISEEYRGAYGGYDLIIKLSNTLNPIYINTLFNSNYKEKLIMPLTRRAAQPHLNAQQVKALLICYPPIELQNQFAEIVQKIEAQKQLMEQSLTEMENNYNSLMQRAFSGKSFS